MERDFFSSVDYLEPKCKHCGCKVVYGESTTWDDEQDSAVCTNCNNPLEIMEEHDELEFENCVQ